jgi:hypothetical protein
VINRKKGEMMDDANKQQREMMEDAIKEQPLDYQDENGIWWVMCACGHRVGGSARPGDKIAVCVNCRFMYRFMATYGGKRTVEIVYPDRMPTDGTLEQQGDHPDHIAERTEQSIKKEKSEKRKAQRLAKKAVK